tara:strand:- start:132 stop:272 length:141 start_codon:yes stop_codon:yes gene_type:complete
MTKRRYKDERKKVLKKYLKPMSEIADEELRDEKGWIWLRDLIDYNR